MKRTLGAAALALASLAGAGPASAEIVARAVKADLTKPDPKAAYWQKAPVEKVSLLAQPMAIPRPATTLTSEVSVQAVHDDQWLAVRLTWKDADLSEAGRLGEFSDAAAIQFPVKSNEAPPPVFMGAKDNPVHIYHWRAQYQRDKLRGKPTMKDLYPNLSIDIYPLEFKDPGSLGETPTAAREQFSPGVAEGNPQSYAKTGVDEIVAEGFSTSSVQEGHGSAAEGAWANGEWSVVITRRLANEGGSTLKVGAGSFMGFAVWQGGAAEVGSRKSVTMIWTPLRVDGTQLALGVAP
ncbi:ethylbenzene dehydrogenase-related protein [Myxococcota bacterium]|nr:ethylbenzene dehydrogenase-related protein [Myxococcota bacterium]